MAILFFIGARVLFRKALREHVAEPPGLVERVVHRRGRGADDVGLAEVARRAGLLELGEHVLRLLVYDDRKLTAAVVHLARRDDVERLAKALDPLEQEPKVA